MKLNALCAPVIRFPALRVLVTVLILQKRSRSSLSCSTFLGKVFERLKIQLSDSSILYWCFDTLWRNVSISLSHLKRSYDYMYHCFNIKSLNYAHGICVSRDAQNIELLFHYTKLIVLCNGDVLSYLYGRNWICKYYLHESEASNCYNLFYLLKWYFP
jgi:hypothetical protein